MLADNMKADLVFQITATLLCGRRTYSAATNLSVNIKQPRSPCIEVVFSFKTLNSHFCEWVPVKMFVDKIAEFYGFSLHQDVLVLNYSRILDTSFSIKVTFSKRRISCDPCDFTALTNLTDRIMQKSNGTIRMEFLNFMSPTFAVTSVQVVAIGNCIALSTTSVPVPTTTR